MKMEKSLPFGGTQRPMRHHHTISEKVQEGENRQLAALSKRNCESLATAFPYGSWHKLLKSDGYPAFRRALLH